MIDRRTFLGLAGAGLLTAGVHPTPAVAETQIPIPPGPGWTLLGQAPNALAQLAWDGSTLLTLFPDGKRIYYGYGNYGTNAGSASSRGIDISYFDVELQSFAVAMPSYPTEEVNTFRRIGAAVAVPTIDPAWRIGSCAISRSGWHAAAGISNAEHVFDVARGLTDDELFVCGSAGSGTAVTPTIWRSTDAGASWSIFFQEPVDSGYADGYERFYWLARMGDALYCRADLGSTFRRAAPMRKYDLVTRRWSTVSNTGLKTGLVAANGGPLYVGNKIRRASDVQVVGAMAYFSIATGLYAFDGTRAIAMSKAVGSCQCLTIGDDGFLYAGTSAGAYRIKGTTATLVSPGRLSSLAVAGGVLYSGAAQGTLYSKPLP